MASRAYPRSILFLLCALVILTTGVLVGLNIFLQKRSRATKTPSLSPAITSPDKALEPPPSPILSTDTLHGVVQKKEATRLILLSDSSSSTVTVETAQAMVYQETLKPPTFIQREMPIPTNTLSPPAPPSPHVQKRITLSDIPLGALILIRPANAQNAVVTAEEIIYPVSHP